ncbi:Rv2231c family pyridoxal phosphate-dependent protein CobC [Rhodococcus sp. IEGM 1379]|uniref:Rv2231c family pyridoxal phosphate-dependent protein CobC n=1 Tax=Rhodococcus sp. IEGM 1379 TaxID=3047086 RepID=UPI0024B7BB52|nr:Rv2231c family pyridoxal phosphate-dependent protein CobC [Rhodococcus sp. IEGM 1379]MDI9914313.1 Rv2231c family pyridoxal phosphate-dependent protein CobC [Rhodococcus sp. IEGM 1379]
MSIGTGNLDSLRHHGDVDAAPGLLDFAVNVQGDGPPPWLRERLALELSTLGSYPSAPAELRARETVAARHGRTPDEVLLLAGGAEGFAMLPRLGSASAALIHPSFTEPELALREAGVPAVQVILEPPYALRTAVVPDEADLVVLGNPTNPTSVLHPKADILALRRPGRILVVDEAFGDAIPGETESIADLSLPDVLVLRSLTKTWALAGLRCGYALGAPDVLEKLAHGRAHWPLGSLQIEAIRACCEPSAVAESQAKAAVIADQRAALCEKLRSIGVAVHEPSAAPFVLIELPDGEAMRTHLRTRGIAVRRCDTFPGLGPNHVRLAVRPPQQVSILIDVMKEFL